MVIHNVEQGSAEWLAIRAGRWTSSEFYKVLSKPRNKADRLAGNLSDTAISLIHSIVDERLTGMPMDSFSTRQTDYGHKYEPVAAARYYEVTGRKITPVGFISEDSFTLPNGERFTALAGASTDGFISYDMIAEIKCPPSKYISMVLENPAANDIYYTQIQKELLISRRRACEYIIFNPRMPKGKDIVIQRILRDEAKITQIIQGLKRVEDEAEKIINDLEKIFNTQKQSK